MTPTNFLDKSIIAGFVLLAMLPFSTIFRVNLGIAIFDASDLLLFFISILLTIAIRFRGVRNPGFGLFISTILVFLFYTLASSADGGVTRNDVIQQLRAFFPFMVASMILAAPLRGNLVRVLSHVTIAVSFSAIAAIVMHLYFREFVQSTFADSNEMAASVIANGRMYWDRAPLGLFVVAAYLIGSDRRMLILFAILVTVVGTLMTQSRTLVLAIVLFALIGNLLSPGKKKFKPLLLTILPLSVFFFFFVTNEDIQELFLARFFLTDAANYEFEVAFYLNRTTAYLQYLDRFIDSFPLGQGLGRPLSIDFTGTKALISDISLVSFVLPLGILGGYLFYRYVNVVLSYSKRFSSDLSWVSPNQRVGAFVHGDGPLCVVAQG